MAKLCGRPGCSEPGTVAYGMVPEDLLFWIAALDGDVAADAAVLCRRHADAMVVPRGWTLDDRRDAVPRLFRPKKNGDDSPPVRRSRRRRADATPPGGIAQELDFQDPPPPRAITATPERLAGAAEDAEHIGNADRWRPTFDTDDDLGGLLEADSPLLARAFRGTGRRRA